MIVKSTAIKLIPINWAEMGMCVRNHIEPALEPNGVYYISVCCPSMTIARLTFAAWLYTLLAVDFDYIFVFSAAFYILQCYCPLWSSSILLQTTTDADDAIQIVYIYYIELTYAKCKERENPYAHTPIHRVFSQSNADTTAATADTDQSNVQTLSKYSVKCERDEEQKSVWNL